MKICPKCGVELNDEALVCSQCGETLEVAAPAKKKPSISLILGIVSIVLGFLGALIGGCTFGLIGTILFCSIPTILGIVALVLGIIEIKKSGDKLGLILGIVAVVLGIIAYPIIGMACGALASIFLSLFMEILYEIM